MNSHSASLDGDDLERIRSTTQSLCDRVQRLAGQHGAINVTWSPADRAPGALGYRLTQGGIELDRNLVQGWSDQNPAGQVQALVEGLRFRTAAAAVFSPPAYLWAEGVDLHVRSEQERGLGSDYVVAFTAAHRILESHRLDRRLLALLPEATDALTGWVLSELGSHPAFDTYPRAALVMGRPHLPPDLVQPSIDEFLEESGLDEATDLTRVLTEYVSLDDDNIDTMIDLAHELVFLAFPDAIGLGWGEEVMSTDVWPFQVEIPADDHRCDGPDGQPGGQPWEHLQAYLAEAFSEFEGHAGLDYGDALLIDLNGDGIDGPHVAGWARGDDISVECVRIGLNPAGQHRLLDHGWQAYENSPDSVHQQFPTAHASHLAEQIVGILKDLNETSPTDSLTLYGRGHAADVSERYWSHPPVSDPLPGDPSERDPSVGDPSPGHSRPVWPTDHRNLVDLVREALDVATGGECVEYEPGRYEIEPAGVEAMVIVDERAFPLIRFEHMVSDVPDHRRTDVIEFVNALAGRASTAGAHWWLGDHTLWQVATISAAKYDRDIFLDHLQMFINVAIDRTPEVRARFGPPATDSDGVSEEAATDVNIKMAPGRERPNPYDVEARATQAAADFVRAVYEIRKNITLVPARHLARWLRRDFHELDGDTELPDDVEAAADALEALASAVLNGVTPDDYDGSNVDYLEEVTRLFSDVAGRLQRITPEPRS